MDAQFIAEMDTEFADFRQFRVSTLDPSNVRDEETGGFLQVVLALCQANEGNYTALRRSYEKDNQTMMAWACRNLLEVAIFTRFVLKSKTNEEDFAADRLIDALDIVRKLKDLERELDPNYSATELDDAIRDCRKQMREENVTRSRYLSTRVLAKQVGLASEYDTMNQVCSKFIHPTAWSLLTADARTARFPKAGELFYRYGARYFATISAEIRLHVENYGLRHKP